jgi:predicted phage terminase large subunit-like protein
VKKKKKLELTPQLIEGFQKVYLKNQFDGNIDTADFHVCIWEDICSGHPRIATAAPRAHAKSTSVTHTVTLAAFLFRCRDFGLIISDTEDQGIKFLANIRNELVENQDLIKDFGFKGLVKDAATELIGEFNDGSQFCLLAKGSGQKVRGLTWRNKRPNYIIGDDLENDDTVQNKESLKKFKEWFQNALVPCGSKDCLYIIVGTILHSDSLLQNLLDSKEWKTRRYSAHHSFDDFSEVLWPDMWDEARLRQRRQEFIESGNEDGYAREYLNQPISSSSAYFKKEYLKDITLWDKQADKTYYAAVDFAISQSQTADHTVIVVAGVTSDNVVVIEEVRKGRWDSPEIIDQLLAVQEEFSPEKFILERGAISLALGPYLDVAMVERNIYLDLELVVPSKDKRLRARSIQASIKAGGVKFDKEAEWWPSFEMELLQFPRGKHDDQVDALAHVGMYLHKIIRPLSAEEEDEDEWERESRDHNTKRNKYTGY